MLFDEACDRVLARFEFKNMKYLQRKAIAQRSWKMVSMFLKFNHPNLDHKLFSGLHATMVVDS